MISLFNDIEVIRLSEILLSRLQRWEAFGIISNSAIKILSRDKCIFKRSIDSKNHKNCFNKLFKIYELTSCRILCFSEK